MHNYILNVKKYNFLDISQRTGENINWYRRLGVVENINYNFYSSEKFSDTDLNGNITQDYHP